MANYLSKIAKAERTARLEEQVAFGSREREKLEKEFKERVVTCLKTFDDIRARLDVVNREQGETKKAIDSVEKAVTKLGNDLSKLINSKVSSPLSRKDRVVLWSALITGGCGIIIAIISILPRFFGL